jgi:hypothetical protein
MRGSFLGFAVFGISLWCALAPVHASSPDSWAELWKTSEASCRKAVNFKNDKVRGPVDFEAAVLWVIEGRYPQPHMKNAKGVMYCLYDKTTHKTQVSEVTPK